MAGRLGQITVRVTGDAGHKPGETVGLAFDTDSTRFFDKDGQAI